MFAVTGARTTIVRELSRIAGEDAVRIEADLARFDTKPLIPMAPRYVLAAGVLHGRRLLDQTAAQISECLAVNFVNVVRVCELILAANPDARICVIGSESAYRGSHDQLYAMSKAAVHRYVEHRQVEPRQQLVAVAPHIILDSGMTRARNDYAALADSVSRGRRFIGPDDVASAVYFALWAKANWINNTVIRMAG